MKSCNYPVYVEIPDGNYSVSRVDCSGSSEEIFSGHAYGPDGSATVDLAHISKEDFNLMDRYIPDLEHIEGHFEEIVIDLNSSILDICTDGNGRFVATGSIGMYVSTNGVDWTTQNTSFIGVGCATDGGVWIDCRQGNSSTQRIFWSSDLNTWSGVTGNFPYNATSCVYTNGRFVATSNQYYIYYSPEGINFWTNVTHNTSYLIWRCAGSFKGNFLLGCQNNISVTPDFSSWVDHSLGLSTFIPRSIASNDNIVVGAGSSSSSTQNAFYSTDGENFTLLLLPSGDNQYADIYGSVWNPDDEEFLMCGAGGYIYQSINGIDWVSKKISEHQLNSVVWSGDMYYITTNNGSIIRYVPGSSATYIEDIGAVNTYTTVPDTGEHVIAYDYNTDYISELGDYKICNDPIRYEVYPGQPVCLTVYDEVCSRSKTLTTSTGEFDTSSLRSLDFWAVAGGEDTFTMSAQVGDETLSVEYKVVSGCFKYILFYVNKQGGMDHLIMKGNYQQTHQSSQFDINTNYDRTYPDQFQNTRIQNTAERRLALNTGFMSDEESSRIDNLFLSPRVWVYDIETEQKRAVLISDTSFQTKKYRDGSSAINYTVNVIQSQDVIRR